MLLAGGFPSPFPSAPLPGAGQHGTAVEQQRPGGAGGAARAAHLSGQGQPGVRAALAGPRPLFDDGVHAGPGMEHLGSHSRLSQAGVRLL